MPVISATTKTLPELIGTNTLSDGDMLLVELANGGSRKITWAALMEAISGGAAIVKWDEVVSVQTEDNQKIPTAALVYAMNKVLTVMEREQACINGSIPEGIEWDLDDLMPLVRAGNFKEFAIGDYFIDSALNKKFAIAAKNHYPAWAFNGASVRKNHIVAMPFEGIAKYQFNSSNVNSGGYAGSLMPGQLATLYGTLSAKTKGYCVPTKIYENNKGAWAAVMRDMRLPTVMEVTGDRGWAANEGYSNGTSGQLPLCKSALFRILPTDWYWMLDPDSTTTTTFCTLANLGTSSSNTASTSGSVRPLITLA